MSLPLLVNTTDPTQSGLLDDFLSPGSGIDPDLVFNDIMLAVSHRPVKPSTTNYRPWDDDFETGDTFQVAVGTPGGVPSAGTFLLGVPRKATKTVISTSMADPTKINCTAHGVNTGDYVFFLTSTGSTPDLVGNYYPAIKVDADNFTVPVNVTSAGTGGTFNSYNTSGLTLLAWNISAATLQTALSTVTNAEGYGSATVTLLDTGNYEITLASPTQAFAAIYGNGGALIPQSTINVSQITPGSSTSPALQIIELQQQPVAYCEPATLFPAADVTASIAQAGSGSQNKVYTVDFTPGTYDGSFSITMTTIASVTSTTVISANIQQINAAAISAQLNAAAGITQGDIAVSGSTASSLTITFQGAQKQSNAPVLSVTNIDLQAPQGVSGFMSLNTINLYLAFSQTTADTLPFTLSIRRTRLTGEQAEYFLAAITLKRNLITGTVLVPLQLASYYTQAQSDARFASILDLMRFTYLAGGGTPTAGTFTTDNSSPASTTQIKISTAAINGGTFQIFLAAIAPGAHFSLLGENGHTETFRVLTTPNLLSGRVVFSVLNLNPSGSNFSGVYALTGANSLLWLPSYLLLGTTTIGDASAGYMGEEIQTLVASGSAVSLTTATAANVANVSLTAGDWDVEGNVNLALGSATVTAESAGISLTSATLPTDGSEVYSAVQLIVTSENDSITIPRKRVNVSTTTTVYLVAKATFSAGTVAAFGAITARRVR